jgi:hypothetical protein
MKNYTDLFRLFFFVSLIILLFPGCDNSLFRLKGTGETVTQEIFLENFDKIDMAIDANIFLYKGDTQKIEIEAQKNIIENIKVNVRSGKWNIDYDETVGKHNPVKIYITLPEISQIILSGSGDIYSEDTFDVENLKLLIPGSGDIDFAVNTDNADISVSGSGTVFLEGNTIDQDISVSGSGNCKCFSFFSEKTDISISGSGNCEVFARDNLLVDISGSGNVYYKGNPDISSHITGSGDVIDEN